MRRMRSTIFLHHARGVRPMPMAVVPFGGNQFTVPSHQRIRRDQGLEFVQYLAAQHLGPSRQPTSFCIGEADPLPAQVCLEHAVLFLEILDYVQLVAVDPTGDHHEQKGNEVEAAKTWRVIISTSSSPRVIEQLRSAFAMMSCEFLGAMPVKYA
jgi:hypothetical protein